MNCNFRMSIKVPVGVGANGFVVESKTQCLLKITKGCCDGDKCILKDINNKLIDNARLVNQ